MTPALFAAGMVALGAALCVVAVRAWRVLEARPLRPLEAWVGRLAAVAVMALPLLADAGALQGPRGGGGNALPRTGGTMTGQVVFDSVVNDISTESGGDLKLIPSASSATNGRVIIGTSLNQQQVNPTSLSGDVNNYAGCNNYGICNINSGGSARNITGLSGGLAGDVLIICAVNAAGALTLKHSSASSSAGNKFFFNGATDRTIAVEECFSVVYVYDGTNSYWRELK